MGEFRKGILFLLPDALFERQAIGDVPFSIQVRIVAALVAFNDLPPYTRWGQMHNTATVACDVRACVRACVHACMHGDERIDLRRTIKRDGGISTTRPPACGGVLWSSPPLRPDDALADVILSRRSTNMASEFARL